MEKETVIVTRDLHLAAVLVAYGSSIIQVDRSNPKQMFFYFDRMPPRIYIMDTTGCPVVTSVTDLCDLRALFFSKRLFFPPSFVDCLRSVRSYIFAG